MTRMVLLMADGAETRAILARLRAEKYSAVLCPDAARGLLELQERTTDLVLLDPGLIESGDTALLRRVGEITRAPILVISGTACAAHKVAALDAGADDYLVRPLDLDELAARIRRSLRRGPLPLPGALSCGRLTLCPASRRVTVGDDPVALTVREFDLLEFFMRHPNIALSRNQLLNGVWGVDFYGAPKVVDVYVRYLRDKLDNRYGVSYIVTVRGVGYMFVRDGNA